MKKIINLVLLTLILTTLTACGANYVVDISDMPEEQRLYQEGLLADALGNYENAETDSEKSLQAFEIGYQYMVLGQHGKAIPYYEEVLQYDAVHYPVLTNLAYIYETAGNINKALEYEQRLYDRYYTEYGEVNSDIVRLLLKDGQIEKTTQVVDALAEIDLGKNSPEFVEDLYEKIEKAKLK